MAANGKATVFKDVIAARRTGSDLMWVSRSWVPVSAYIQPHKSSASQIKHTVLHSTRLKQVVEEISNEEHIPPEQLYKQVEDILNEMGYNKDVPIMRWLALLTAKLLKKLCSAILVNEEMLLKVKSQLGGNPVLLVPTHRSYGDFILMSYICFHYEMDIPRIAAAMDFHAMVLMGRMLRDSCAFFMRRSFADDKLYTAIFRQYVQTLVTDGDAAVEFFIEGTRSRTGKSLMPKFGFLSMALKPFLTGLVPDISIVPISISYDRPLEEVLFAYEMLGVPKPKESTRRFMKALSVLNDNYGNVFIEVSEPISVKAFLGSKVDRSVHGFGPVALQDVTTDETKQMPALAHAVVARHQSHCTLSLFTLVAAVINNNVAAGGTPLPFPAIVKKVAWLIPIVRALGAFVYLSNEDDVEGGVRGALELHRGLVHDDGAAVRLRRVHTPGTSPAPGRSKGHALAEATMDSALPLMMLQHYVNPLAHCLANLCLVVLALGRLAAGDTLDREDLFSKFRFLRVLFSYEFVFYVSTEKDDFEKALGQGERLGAVQISGSRCSLGKDMAIRAFCNHFLAPFIPGYAVVVGVLMQATAQVTTESALLKSSQKSIEAKLSDGTIVHPANLSLDLLSNAVQSLVALGAVLKSKSNGGVAFTIIKEKLSEIHKEILLMDSYIPKNIKLSKQFSSFLNGKL